MIEQIVLDYLQEKLPVHVAMEEISDMPAAYVLIEKTGSGGDWYIKTATFAIQSYGESLHKTAELNEKVKETMEQIIELDSVTKCSLNSDYNYTDNSRKKYRYQAVFDITHY